MDCDHEPAEARMRPPRQYRTEPTPAAPLVAADLAQRLERLLHRSEPLLGLRLLFRASAHVLVRVLLHRDQ